MGISKPSLKNKNEIWIYTFLIVVSALSALFAVENIKISPDSMRFGLISQQILSGNGIRVPIIRLEDTYIPVNGAIPFLDQMPLLPILFALLGGVTPQSFWVAKTINLISHVAISIFTFLLMKNLYGKRDIALLAGILVTVSFPLLSVTHYMWSEPLFIALTVASMFFLILSRNSDSLFSRNILIAGTLASAAILTRNTGIAMISVFFWEGFVLVKNKRPESKYISTILAIILPIVTTVAMLIRNYIISGNLRGFNQVSPERTYIDAVTGTVEMIFLQFQLGKKASVLIILFMMLFTLCILVSANLRKEILKYFNAGLDSIMVFIGSYTILIVYAMAKQAWNYELRLVSPLVPFLFISCIFIILLTWKTIELQGFSKLSLSGMIVSLSILAMGNSYKSYLNFPEFSYEQTNQYSILRNCTYKWLKENYGKHIVIVTNRPFHLSFFGGYSTVALPHKKFDPNINVPDDMEIFLPNRMYKFGSHILALFETAEEKYDGSYITELFNNRATNDKFNLLYECADGMVYEPKEQKSLSTP
jgi:hypothetical protein